MPIARLLLIEGASDDQKRALIAKVTDAFEESVGAPRSLVRVLIEELPAMNWGVGGEPFADRQNG